MYSVRYLRYVRFVHTVLVWAAPTRNFPSSPPLLLTTEHWQQPAKPRRDANEGAKLLSSTHPFVCLLSYLTITYFPDSHSSTC